MSKHLTFVSLMVLLTSSDAWGLQRYEFNEEKRIEGVISSTELNRIKIEGDRIKQLVGLSRDFIVEGDEINGQIFIKASSESVSKPAVFSIITEGGRTQDFKMSPKGISGETIIIEGYMKGLISDNAKGEIGVRHSKHQELIEVIKKAALEEGQIEGATKEKILGLSAVVLSDEIIDGYQVKTFEVENDLESGMEIDERYFADESGACAVATEKVYINPGERARVYVVIKR